jgi:APA family basic amino acid/polyamine antiporter
LVLRYTRPDLHRPFRAPAIWFTSIMGVGFCGWMAYSLPNATWWRLLGWSLVGFAVYFLYGYRHSRLRRPGDPPLDADAAASAPQSSP